MASLAINPFNNNQVQTSNLTRYSPPGPQENFGGYFSGGPSAPGYGYETSYNPWGGNSYNPYNPYGNPNQDPNMAWYNQTIKPGMDDVTRTFDETERRLSNFGFNEYNKSADKNKEALETLKGMVNKVGGDDGIFVEQEMRDALNDNTGKYSGKEKAAIRYMLEVKQNDSGVTLWETLDGKDGVVSLKDINPALKGNLSPDSLTDEGLTPYK